MFGAKISIVQKSHVQQRHSCCSVTRVAASLVLQRHLCCSGTCVAASLVCALSAQTIEWGDLPPSARRAKCCRITVAQYWRTRVLSFHCTEGCMTRYIFWPAKRSQNVFQRLLLPRKKVAKTLSTVVSTSRKPVKNRETTICYFSSHSTRREGCSLGLEQMAQSSLPTGILTCHIFLCRCTYLRKPKMRSTTLMGRLWICPWNWRIQ